MKIFRRSIAVFVVLGALFAVVGAQQVAAQSSVLLTEEQQRQLQTNCTTIKSSLSQLHASDALLRVNRGQIYEAMKSRLMDRFNARLTSNSLDARGLISTTQDYQEALERFRSNYQQYERQLAALIRIDCVENPQSFYTTLQDAREKRGQVYETVTAMDQLIDDYRTGVSDFRLNFERISGSDEE